MSAVSDYLANKLTDWELRGQTFTPPATVYVALLLCSNGPLARSTAYTVGQTVSYVAADGYNHLYACTTAGTTAATAPAYPGAPGEAITDGTAVFTEQDDVLAAAGSTLVEVSGNAYARASIASSLTDWSGTQGSSSSPRRGPCSCSFTSPQIPCSKWPPLRRWEFPRPGPSRPAAATTRAQVFAPSTARMPATTTRGPRRSYYGSP